MEAKKHFEIERKFLVEKPNLETIRQNATIKKIVKIYQTYLKSDNDGSERRIRLLEKDNIAYSFRYTEKKEINGIKREETEREITIKEYLNLMLERDPSLLMLVKMRVVFEYKEQVFELDLFEDLNGSDVKALLEIELESEDTRIDKFPFINIISEVTNNLNYRNRKIAETGSL